MIQISRIYTLSVLILSLLTSICLQAPSILPCTIQFPQMISNTPTIRVYHGGEIRQSSVDQGIKTITFNILKYPQQSEFHVVITESIDFASYSSKYQTNENNTAAYIKLKTGQPYLLFTLTLIPKRAPTQASHEATPGKQDNGNQPSYSWHISKVTNQDGDNKIPDDAIIVCMRPDWVHSMQSDNSFELPTIKIKSNIVEQSGSEKAFYEQAVRLQLAAIDSDTLHGASSEQLIKQDQNRIMIAAPTA